MRRAGSWILVVAGAGGLAAAMSCSTLHRFQGSDSVVPVLVSLQRWTPFFWQQDRFGMLIPLLAMPVHDPLMNLAVPAGNASIQPQARRAGLTISRIGRHGAIDVYAIEGR